MDIILERILSLVPKKENGDFKHGALSEFARSLGFKDGHIISDWIAENSTSYKNYLYQISALHNVSVEWLKGETDEKDIKKERPAQDGALSDVQLEAWQLIQQWDDDKLKKFIAAAKAMLGE